MRTPSIKAFLMTLLFLGSASIASAQFCGNELCETGETASTCPFDCGICGDLVCNPCPENSSCSDCHCGDFICDSTENPSACPQDCLGSVCGDLVCDVGETCLKDCGEGTAPLCGGGAGPCGNGIVESGEECDDGNTADGDCCSSLCRFETASCNDGNACTTGDQCQGGRCSGGAPVTCDDGRACNGVETCDPSLGCPSPGACDGEFKGGGGCGLAAGSRPSLFLVAWILLPIGMIQWANRRKVR